MPSRLRVTFARLCLDTRTALDVTQRALAEAVGVSRAYISAIECGAANPSLDMVARIAETLGIEIDLMARPPIATSPRQHDIVHARCSGYVDRRLRRAGWDVLREVEVVHGRSHGWIDLLAFDSRTGTLLVVEVKTRIDDFGAIERQLSWYERSAMALARAQGWRPLTVRGWLLVLASDEVERSLKANGLAVAAAFPARAAEMQQIVIGDQRTAGPGRGVAPDRSIEPGPNVAHRQPIGWSALPGTLPGLWRSGTTVWVMTGASMPR